MNIKRFSIITGLTVLAILLTGCIPGPPTPPVPGLYLGIIGFNDDVYYNPISLLNTSSANSHKNFINDRTMKANTALYHAVNTAMDKIEKFDTPSDLRNISIITFTDGYDNISHEYKYPGSNEYKNHINSRKNKQIKGMYINSYAIGLLGETPSADDDNIEADLNSIANGSPSRVKMSRDMQDIYDEFEVIARELREENRTYSTKISFAPPPAGTKMRFTFDGINNVEESVLFIEGVYSSDGKLTGITYNGLRCSSGTSIQTATVSGSKSRSIIFNDFALEENKEPVPLGNFRLWKYEGRWKEDVEFDPSSNTTIDVKESSSIIMLVLDCSTSLGHEDFNKIKNAAKAFIDVLLENTSGDNFLPAPDNITAVRNTHNSSVINITWNPVSGAESYKIYYKRLVTGSGLYDGESYTNSYTSYRNPTSLPCYFRVAAVNSNGIEGQSSSWIQVAGEGTINFVGTWEGYDGEGDWAEMMFSNDYKWTIVWPEKENTDWYGTYTVSGNTATLYYGEDYDGTVTNYGSYLYVELEHLEWGDFEVYWQGPNYSLPSINPARSVYQGERRRKLSRE